MKEAVVREPAKQAAMREPAKTPVVGVRPPVAPAPRSPKRRLTPVGPSEEQPPEPVEIIDPESWLSTIDEAG